MTGVPAGATTLLQVISAVVAIAAAAAAAFQVRTMRQQAANEHLYEVTRELMMEPARRDRSDLFRIAQKPFDDWSDADRVLADRICFQFTELGLLVQHGHVPTRELIDWTNGAISKSFAAAQQYVEHRRCVTKEPHTFAYFEWLARLEIQAKRRKIWSSKRKWHRTISKTDAELATIRESIQSRRPGGEEQSSGHQ